MNRLIMYYEKKNHTHIFSSKIMNRATFCGHQYVNHAYICESHLPTHAQRVTLCVYIRQLQIDARTQ